VGWLDWQVQTSFTAYGAFSFSAHEDRIDALCVVSRVCEGSRAAASLVGAVQRLAVMSAIMVLWESLARWLQCEDLDLPKSLSSAICS
jgi:hypothetical protein